MKRNILRLNGFYAHPLISRSYENEQAFLSDDIKPVWEGPGEYEYWHNPETGEAAYFKIDEEPWTEGPPCTCSETGERIARPIHEATVGKLLTARFAAERFRQLREHGFEMVRMCNDPADRAVTALEALLAWESRVLELFPKDLERFMIRPLHGGLDDLERAKWTLGFSNASFMKCLLSALRRYAAHSALISFYVSMWESVYHCGKEKTVKWSGLCECLTAVRDGLLRLLSVAERLDSQSLIGRLAKRVGYETDARRTAALTRQLSRECDELYPYVVSAPEYLKRKRAT